MENSSNEKQTENQGEKKYNYVYFNFKQEKSKQYKVSLSSNYNASDTLELIEEKDLDYNAFMDPLIIKIYRFRIVPDFLEKNENNEFKIDVILEEDNGTKHNYSIIFKDIDKDFYEYKLRMEGIDILPLELDEQFQIYLDILRNKYKKNQKTKENEDFISSSLLLLKDEDNKYDLLFYLSIFLNCFATDFVQNNLLAFDPKKIKGIGEIPERRLKPIKNIINQMVKNPEKIHVKEKESIEETTKLFYSLALYFNFHFQKEKIEEMFENDKICDHLFISLLSYCEFFKDLILPKKYVIKLIRKAKNYDQILTLLFYLGTDFSTFIEVVKETKDLIYTFMKKNGDNKIEIEKYVEPKKEDDLENILSLLEGLKSFTIFVNEDMKLIKFSSLIIEKYAGFYEEINLDKLIILKYIVDSIKLLEPQFVCNCNIEEKLHRTGLKLVKIGKIKNIKIIEFIKTDVYFLNKNYNKKLYRPLEILDGINISLIEDKKQFFKKWNDINFYSMFESQIEDFLKKIASLISEMKDFGYLFKFYIIKQENPFEVKVVKALQNRFIELLPTYNNKECPNFIEDVVELIYISDKNKVDIKKFLTETIEKKFCVKTVNDIYVNLTNNKEGLSKECNKIILKYFTKCKENSDPKSLSDLIYKCKNLRDDMLSNINKFILKEDDILNFNETKNYIFFRELVNKKIINKIQNKKEKYIIETMSTINSFKEKIEKLEIKYNDLYPFFKEGGEVEEKLKNKFEIIFLNEIEVSHSFFDMLKAKVLLIKKIKEDFDLIFCYFFDLYPNSHSEDINNIAIIILSLYEKNLNYFELNYKKDYEKYIKYLDKAKENLKKKNCKFYSQIFNNFRRIYEKDDEKFVQETEKKFNELRVLFEDNGIDKIDEKTLILCAKPFIEKKGEISKELKKLMEIFKISKNNNDNLENDIILIVKREYFFDATSSIVFFIEYIGAKEENYFTKIIKDVIPSFKERANISLLKEKLTLLNNSDIDLLNGDNNYIKILMKLNGKEEIINFLFNITIQECRNIQEILSESENTFVTINDLLDMEKCVEFFMKLGKKEDLKLKNDVELIKFFNETLSKYDKALLFFTNFVDKYNQIKLLQTSMDKSTFLKNIIDNIINGSTFIITNTKENSFQCNYNKKSKSGKSSESKDDIISFRERAQLSKRVTPSYKFFIESISEILNISNMMNNIYKKGFPRTITIKIIFESNNENEHKDDEDKVNIKKKYFMDNKEIDNIELRNKLANIL